MRTSYVGRVSRSRPAGLPLDEALAIARQIADALQAAHEKGIIHRDLEPANSAFTSTDQVKVLDFGLAKTVESSSGWCRRTDDWDLVVQSDPPRV